MKSFRPREKMSLPPSLLRFSRFLKGIGKLFITSRMSLYIKITRYFLLSSSLATPLTRQNSVLTIPLSHTQVPPYISLPLPYSPHPSSTNSTPLPRALPLVLPLHSLNFHYISTRLDEILDSPLPENSWIVPSPLILPNGPLARVQSVPIRGRKPYVHRAGKQNPHATATRERLLLHW